MTDKEHTAEGETGTAFIGSEDAIGYDVDGLVEGEAETTDTGVRDDDTIDYSRVGIPDINQGVPFACSFCGSTMQVDNPVDLSKLDDYRVNCSVCGNMVLVGERWNGHWRWVYNLVPGDV